MWPIARLKHVLWRLGAHVISYMYSWGWPSCYTHTYMCKGDHYTNAEIRTIIILVNRYDLDTIIITKHIEPPECRWTWFSDTIALPPHSTRFHNAIYPRGWWTWVSFSLSPLNCWREWLGHCSWWLHHLLPDRLHCTLSKLLYMYNACIKLVYA